VRLGGNQLLIDPVGDVELGERVQARVDLHVESLRLVSRAAVYESQMILMGVRHAELPERVRGLSRQRHNRRSARLPAITLTSNVAQDGAPPRNHGRTYASAAPPADEPEDTQAP
jgi:hypothetical protein